MTLDEVAEKCVENLRKAGLNVSVEKEAEKLEGKMRCQKELPEPIGVLKCFEEPKHKGVCAYSGLFKCHDGTELFVTVAWGKRSKLSKEDEK